MVRAVIEDVKNCIDENKSFILEAGAGAGKTYTLIQTIDYIQSVRKNKSNILCITYTNVAKEEIKRRVKDPKIEVNTLHEFLWGFIKQFQLELIKIVEQIIANEKIEIEEKIAKARRILEKPTKRTNISKKTQELENEKKRLAKYEVYEFKEIKYTGYKQLYKGNLGHDDVLKISVALLENPIFVNILLNQYTHIFIDEYQDTNLELLNKILELVSENSQSIPLVIGLFGDRMQQIYSNGSLDFNWDELGFKVIEKTENHRSNEIIIKANNSLRGDGFNQTCENNEIPLNKLEFIINANTEDKFLKKYLNEDFSLYKRLYLTHKEIALDLGFQNISEIFDNEYDGFFAKDKLLNLEDLFISFVVNDILYDINTFLKNNHKPLIDKLKSLTFTITDLEILFKNLKNEIKLDKPLKYIIEILRSQNLFNESKYRSIYRYYEDYEREDFIKALLNVKFKEYLNFFNYIKKETSLETMAGVKGEEYENVIVNVNSELNWSKYNFNEFFLTGIGDANSLRNTHKLFYVCCTRAKSSLIINYIINDVNEEKIQMISDNINALFANHVQIYFYDSALKKYPDLQQV